jgi:hypothetical protein
MRNLLLAELKKVVLNYKLTSFLVWVFPVGVAAFYTIANLAALLPDKQFAINLLSATSGISSAETSRWTTDAVSIWGVISSFPVNILGRMLPLAFMAVVFASEYQWGTWKNLVPRRGRTALMVSKFVILTALLVTSFLLASACTVLGQAIGRRLTGMAYEPALGADVLRSFAETFFQTIFLGVISLLILAGVAALAAILTRSVLAGMLVGFGFSMVDSVSMMILMVLGYLFGKPELVDLFRFTSSYNLQNAMSWFQTDAAYVPVGTGFTGEPSLAFSLILLFLWTVGLIVLAIWAFRRQDINA